MCGIVGATGQRDIAGILIDGLKRLEYRGYDSAGMAVLDGTKIQRIRSQGKVNRLQEALGNTPLLGQAGIAHTRWATHGKPSEKNAHPQMSGTNIAVVHNGIIENFELLKKNLQDTGYNFDSETDTEVIAHCIHFEMTQGLDLFDAVKKVVTLLKGAFALGIICEQEPDRMIAVRHGSPLVIGIGDSEHFIASDQLALLPITDQFVYLEEGDIANITFDQYTIHDNTGNKVTRQIHHISSDAKEARKGQYSHFMLKEIYDQPIALCETLEGRIDQGKLVQNIFGEATETLFSKVENIQIVACGTSYHAGMAARYWFEGLAGIPCQVEVASEIRYRKTVVRPNTLYVTISQSGETADTLAALKQAKQQNYLGSLTICNVPNSALARESDFCIMTRAGIEIGVASTKAFTTQLTALLLLTIAIGKHNQFRQEENIVDQLTKLPNLVEQALQLNDTIKDLAAYFSDKHHSLFLGRGVQYPIALEGALKLKEISYIHAEAYPAGELKHGPLALVDDNMPVIAVAPNDELLEKLRSNLHEVEARGGKLIVFADKEITLKTSDNLMLIPMPSVPKDIAPIVYTIPLQLLAYHVAVIKGTDIDQPRNLAKSVTVE